MTTRTALIVTTVFALVLMGCGAALHRGSQVIRRGTPRAVIPVRVVELNPATGAVIWSSFAYRTHVVLDPATGSTVSPP